jgi:hypothetical protein
VHTLVRLSLNGIVGIRTPRSKCSGQCLFILRGLFDSLILRLCAELCLSSATEFVTTFKNVIFWEITSCNLVEIYQRFGWTYSFRRQARRINRTSNKYCLLGLLLDRETSVNFYQTTRRNMPGDNSLWNVRSRIISMFGIQMKFCTVLKWEVAEIP